jgi:putative nucleotidyltransferase with HDIG domain
VRPVLNRRQARRPILWPLVATVGSVVGITILVGYAGTDSIAVHLYYLPIMYAGYYFGDYGGIFASLLSTLLCGPWMPARYEMDVKVLQKPTDMVVRMCTFYVVGLAASRLSLELKRRASEAHRLYEVARSITSTLRLNEVLELISQSAMLVMNAKGSVIRLLDEDSDELVVVAMSGLSDEYWSKGRVVGMASEINRRALAGETVQILDVKDEEAFQYPEAAKRAGLSSVLTVPLRTKSGRRGIIRIYAKRRRRFTSGEIELLTTFAEQAAVAIENADLYEDIRRNYYETVRALTTAVEAKDSATFKHSERVTEIADRLGETLGMDEHEREMLRFGSILHDIGKIGVDDDALEAREGETLEQVFYRMHPLIGVSILQPITFLHEIQDVVKYHHERWDGKGFPEGLSGRDIPLHARVVAVADTFDRLQRPDGVVGKSLSTGQALMEIVSRAGTELDPEIVGKFHRMMLDTDAAASTVLADDTDGPSDAAGAPIQPPTDVTAEDLTSADDDV